MKLCSTEKKSGGIGLGNVPESTYMKSTGRSRKLGLILSPVPLKFSEPEKDIRGKKDAESEVIGSEAGDEEEEEEEENPEENGGGSDAGEPSIRAPVFSQQVIAITDVAPALESIVGRKLKNL